MQRQLSEKLSFEDALPDVIDYVPGVNDKYLEGVSAGVVAVLDFSTLPHVEKKKRRPEKSILLVFPLTCPMWTLTLDADLGDDSSFTLKSVLKK